MPRGARPIRAWADRRNAGQWLARGAAGGGTSTLAPNRRPAMIGRHRQAGNDCDAWDLQGPGRHERVGGRDSGSIAPVRGCWRARSLPGRERSAIGGVFDVGAAWPSRPGSRWSTAKARVRSADFGLTAARTGPSIGAAHEWQFSGDDRDTRRDVHRARGARWRGRVEWIERRGHFGRARTAHGVEPASPRTSRHCPRSASLDTARKRTTVPGAAQRPPARPEPSFRPLRAKGSVAALRRVAAIGATGCPRPAAARLPVRKSCLSFNAGESHGSRRLQAPRVLQLGKIPVQRAQRQVAGLASNFQHQAVRETERRTRTKGVQRRSDDVRVLQCQALVVEQ